MTKNIIYFLIAVVLLAICLSFTMFLTNLFPPHYHNLIKAIVELACETLTIFALISLAIDMWKTA